MAGGKTIAFFPEAAFGPALNSVSIARACRALGHRPVFVADVSFEGVFAGALHALLTDGRSKAARLLDAVLRGDG